MMKVDDFISKLELALKEPSYYLSGGWGKWDGSKWGFDCVCLIKGILWGWTGNRNIPRGGGARYASNGVPDIGDNAMYQKCSNKSTNFNNITIGELVWMTGHVGIYVGGGNVIECTCGWNTRRVIKSQIDKQGNRTYNGRGGSAKWMGHGFLPYVDYTKPKEDYFVVGKSYQLTSAKYLRTSPKLGNNIVYYNAVDNYTKSISNNINGKCQLKKGVVIEPTKLVKEGTRIWSSYGNCYWCCQNIDGSKNALRI